MGRDVQFWGLAVPLWSIPTPPGKEAGVADRLGNAPDDPASWLFSP